MEREEGSSLMRILGNTAGGSGERENAELGPTRAAVINWGTKKREKGKNFEKSPGYRLKWEKNANSFCSKEQSPSLRSGCKGRGES